MGWCGPRFGHESIWPDLCWKWWILVGAQSGGWIYLMRWIQWNVSKCIRSLWIVRLVPGWENAYPNAIHEAANRSIDPIRQHIEPHMGICGMGWGCHRIDPMGQHMDLQHRLCKSCEYRTMDSISSLYFDSYSITLFSVPWNFYKYSYIEIFLILNEFIELKFRRLNGLAMAYSFTP